MTAPVQGGLTEAQKNVIRFAAEAFERLSYKDAAGDLRDILGATEQHVIASQSAAPVAASDAAPLDDTKTLRRWAGQIDRMAVTFTDERSLLCQQAAVLLYRIAFVPASGSAQPATLGLPLAAIRQVCMSHWINRDSGDLSTEQLAHNAAISRCLGALKARATQAATVTGAQAGASDAARFAQAIALDDAAEALYAAVLNNAPDGDAIRAEFDAAIKAIAPGAKP